MNDLKQFDLLIVSGYCLSEGRFFYRLKCEIASHGPMYDNEIKMWPLEHVPGTDDKLWFNLRTLRIHKHQRFP